MLWILAAVGHALGDTPHPQLAPILTPALIITPAPPTIVPSDRPDWDWGPEQARRSVPRICLSRFVSVNRSSRG
jgi:hypothetical protein